MCRSAYYRHTYALKFVIEDTTPIKHLYVLVMDLVFLSLSSQKNSAIHV